LENFSDLEKIINVDIENEMKKSFLDYSMSVIVSRALPDVRDGLKPVHRRILYTMYENNLYPDRAYRKCADTVGAVLARYHPHGDTAVYDSMVRLAQDFSLRYNLVDGHGNFGSVDGDPPAAYRYTESRMSKISMEMLTDIEKDTVNFTKNYDDRLKEPEVLPSRFPNLLVNGSTGIAVGMAVNIPPHNLGEVIDGLCYLIDNPDAEIADLMKYIKGPDFPTYGIIMGKKGIAEAYTKGKGKISVRSRAEIVEEKNKNRFKIIVTELPYQVNKARLCEHIADLVKDHKIEGITNIEDHSDRKGMHLEISVKRGIQPKLVLNQLYSYTELQATFGVIMLAIVNGEPKILNLKELLVHYVNFQVEVLTRRTKFNLKKAEERRHILAGLLVAIDFTDEVIKILKSSKSVNEGKEKLISRFNLDEIQAQAIVQMRLGQLTNLEKNKIEEESEFLLNKIKEFKNILENKHELLNILKKELLEIKKKYNDKRRTEIEHVSSEIEIEDVIPQEDCILTFTNFGYIKRQKIDSYKLQSRGGKGISGMSTREEDVVSDMFLINTHDYLLFFTNLGKVYKLRGYEIPVSSRIAKGVNIANLIQLSENEKITSMIRVAKFEEEKVLTMVTKYGVIKRINLNEFENINKNGKIAIKLEDSDELIGVELTDGKQDVLIATKKGFAARIDEKDVRVMGRNAKGVKGIRVARNDEVVGMACVDDKGFILTVSEKGFGRLSLAKEYRKTRRGVRGVTNYHTREHGDVATIKFVYSEDDIILISNTGIIIRIHADSIRECSRTSKGVKLMRLEDGGKIITVTRVPQGEEDFFGGDELLFEQDLIEQEEQGNIKELDMLE